MFWSAIEAASAHRRALPPASWTSAAAAMPEPAPHSTWQPPTSAAKVAPSAMKIPTSPAASIARVISARPMPSARAAPITEPGRQPQEPAVGAATITPIELFVSIIAVIDFIIELSTSHGSSAPRPRAASII